MWGVGTLSSTRQTGACAHQHRSREHKSVSSWRATHQGHLGKSKKPSGLRYVVSIQGVFVLFCRRLLLLYIQQDNAGLTGNCSGDWPAAVYRSSQQYLRRKSLTPTPHSPTADTMSPTADSGRQEHSVTQVTEKPHLLRPRKINHQEEKTWGPLHE